MGFLQEFKAFLEEYKILALAIAFIMGIAATELVQSFVNNIVMPLITPFIPGGDWKTSVLTIGPFNIGWGPFVASMINFIIIAVVVFLVAKYLMGETKVTKK